MGYAIYGKVVVFAGIELGVEELANRADVEVFLLAVSCRDPRVSGCMTGFMMGPCLAPNLPHLGAWHPIFLSTLLPGEVKKS